MNQGSPVSIDGCTFLPGTPFFFSLPFRRSLSFRIISGVVERRIDAGLSQTLLPLPPFGRIASIDGKGNYE